MKNRTLLALVGVVLVAMTGFGIFLPIFPFLALSTGASASAITWAMGAYSLGQFVAAPLWGRLSDRIGRKPVLVAGLAMTALSYLALAHADTVLAMGGARLFGGLMAGNAGAAFAAAADLADDKTRARNMGLLGAAVGVSFILGPALGALLVGPTPDAAAFQRVCEAAAVLAGAAGLAALALVRETRVRGAGGAARARSFSLLAARPMLRVLVITALLLMSAQALMESVFGLWAHDALGWGPREVGLALAGMGVGAALLQGGGAGALARRFGEANVLRAGLASFAAGLMVLAAAATPAPAMPGLALVTIGVALATPALQSLAAAQADEAERGAAMGLNQSAGALGRVIGPALSGVLFDALGRGAPFALAVGLLAAALLLAPARRAAHQSSTPA